MPGSPPHRSRRSKEEMEVVMVDEMVEEEVKEDGERGKGSSSMMKQLNTINQTLPLGEQQPFKRWSQQRAACV
eukprot:jgi/Chlat1/8581/Chrsp82S07984